MVNRAQQALQFFTSALGLTPAQAAGLVGNLQQESGADLNPSARGDNGASFGIAQWNRFAGRLPALNAFAEKQGSDPADFQTQLAFLAHELQTSEKSAFDRIRAAKTPAEAATAAVSFFRPSDPRTENRVANAAALVGDPVEGDARYGNPRPQTENMLMANGQRRGLLDAFGPDENDRGLLGYIGGRQNFGDFLGDLGTGILLSAGSPVGRSIGQAFQFADERGRARMENDIIRQQLTEAGRKREALAELRSLFQENPDVTASDSRVRSLLFEIDPASAIETMTAQPSGLEAKLGTVQSAIGRPLTEGEILGLAGGGTTINLNDAKADEPLSISDIGRVRLPDGTAVPIGTTAREAKEMGARVVSAEELKKLDDSERALSVLTEIEELAVGEEGIFRDIGSDVLSRGIAAADFIVGDLIEQDPKVSGFRGLSSGTLGSLIRSLGEAGALSDSDVERAHDLLPKQFPFADSEETAREKLKTLRRILNKGVVRLKKLDRGEEVDPEEDAGADSGADFRFDPATGDLVPVR